ncbi:MAG: asparagine synthase (glutamine-hydrolyzing) [Deltaproteobacteria bacterium]|jgi:asparagine synthase (glutamine-hydrolysing)|nr:MAG: asparagine synthase (glutamine-hydrolyzing) [Deltaproteobacteria bacterium]
MCGIAGLFRLDDMPHPALARHLAAMNRIQAHRGPDGEGVWIHPEGLGGFAHRRLSIIDLVTGTQPMTGSCGNTICYNGEIYNYLELGEELPEYVFRTKSDTEVILAAYRKWGRDCVRRLRGMFAFALWDAERRELFCARDRFGIKPFYFLHQDGLFGFASEAKALLPFLPEIRTDLTALMEYLVFQFCLDGKTLYEGIRELPPGHTITVRGGKVVTERYWDVFYNLDFDHTAKYFEEKLRHLLEESVRLHVRSDVPVGAYLSGGTDSGIIAALGCRLHREPEWMAFHGRFPEGEGYDESRYARRIAEEKGMSLHVADIASRDFVETIQKVIYHLDYPVAGPGSFPQYHVSRLAARHRKVVLGGQGGDEIFGGYVRYLLAYFEQCIKGAMEGTLRKGNFIVTYESIIPNLVLLKNYKPLIQEFWREGLFETLDRRYFRLINRASTLEREIRWNEIGGSSPFEAFQRIFNGPNVGSESYFDKMTHFDFKTLLPALLHVEDRMSMAHGLESRVPFLDHPLVEFVATMPSDIKFKDGTLKRVLLAAMRKEVPAEILERKDKMGFPVPLNEWLQGDLKPFVHDLFMSRAARERPYFDTEEILKGITRETRFGRKAWGLISLELWHRTFHDRQAEIRKSLEEGGTTQ